MRTPKHLHPVNAGVLPSGYSVMSSGNGRLRYRAHYNGRQIGSPQASIKRARRLCTDHHEDRTSCLGPPEEVLEVDDEVAARLRAHREEAGRRVG